LVANSLNWIAALTGLITAVATMTTALYTRAQSMPYAKCTAGQSLPDGWVLLHIGVHGGSRHAHIVKISCKDALLARGKSVSYDPATGTARYTHDDGLSSLDCDIDVPPSRISDGPVTFTVFAKPLPGASRIALKLSIKRRWVYSRISAVVMLSNDDKATIH
jgi:hypothetical protein